jgi:hypothetical protein
MKPQQKNSAPQPELIYAIEIPPGRSLCATDLGQRASTAIGIEPAIGTLKQLIVGPSERAVLEDYANRLAAEERARIDAQEKAQPGVTRNRPRGTRCQSLARRSLKERKHWRLNAAQQGWAQSSKASSRSSFQATG